MAKKKRKKKGNEPLRHTPLEMLPITKEQMWVISNQGLVWSVDDQSFIFLDPHNLSGSQVYWANVREIAVDDNDSDLLLTYQNGVKESFPASYEGFDKLIAGIPDHFGWFGHLTEEEQEEDVTIESDDDIKGETPLGIQFEVDGEIQSPFELEYKGEDTPYDDPDEPLSDLESAKALYSELQEKQKAWLAEGGIDIDFENAEEAAPAEEEPAPIAEKTPIQEAPAQEEVAIAPSPVLPQGPGNKASDDLLMSRILAEASGHTADSYAASGDELLAKILQEASGSSYRTSLGNPSATRDLERNIQCPNNSVIVETSSLGFTWKDIGGQLHKVDFGHYSDAYLQDNKALVLEHRYGKQITLPASMKGWEKVLESIPFRFRSIDRQEVLDLVNRRKR